MFAPAYNHLKSLPYNIKHGPFRESQYPIVPKVSRYISFLDSKLNTPFGIPACPLTLNSKYVEHFANLGFDLLTFKSVRSIAWKVHANPNWLYVDIKKPLTTKNLNRIIISSKYPIPNQPVSTANSFGINSPSPKKWIKEYELAKSKLSAGQVLILSLMITPRKNITAVTDALMLAKLALQTTASIIEINLSCPNTNHGGLIYENITLSLEILKTMKEILNERHILAKVGIYKNQTHLKTFVMEASKVISGISSTNTVSMKIANKDGNPAFGKNRENAGVSGAALKELSTEQLKNITGLKRELNLEKFVVIGIGGCTSTKDIKDFLDIGADAVQSATGSWVNPLLAIEFKSKCGN